MNLGFFSTPFGGILGLIHLALFIIALISIWGSARDIGNKLLWTLIVLVFPFIGALLYYAIGRK